MVVVLPAPLGPRKPCTSPVRTSRSSPSRARVGPKVFTSPEIEIAVDIGVVTASFLGPALAVSLPSHATLLSQSCEVKEV